MTALSALGYSEVRTRLQAKAFAAYSRYEIARAAHLETCSDDSFEDIRTPERDAMDAAYAEYDAAQRVLADYDHAEKLRQRRTR